MLSTGDITFVVKSFVCFLKGKIRSCRYVGIHKGEVFRAHAVRAERGSGV